VALTETIEVCGFAVHQRHLLSRTPVPNSAFYLWRMLRPERAVRCGSSRRVLVRRKKKKYPRQTGKAEEEKKKKQPFRKNIPCRWELLMVKPGFLEHCLFVWILLCCSTAEKYIPLLLLAGPPAALKCLEPLEPQVRFTGKGDSALCPPEVPGIRGD